MINHFLLMSYVAGIEYLICTTLWIDISISYLILSFLIFNCFSAIFNSLIFSYFQKLFKNNCIFLSAILFLIHYSNTIKALTWAAFCGVF